MNIRTRQALQAVTSWIRWNKMGRADGRDGDHFLIGWCSIL
ncbi:hypothetical protein [Marinicrinis sediminis]|uniref:Uncharacterized protein n=1 Tax=Marinicrinis sediminis TaxID=1652465 RepID=A0ABW5RBD6_9BACL